MIGVVQREGHSSVQSTQLTAMFYQAQIEAARPGHRLVRIGRGGCTTAGRPSPADSQSLPWYRAQAMMETTPAIPKTPVMTKIGM